MVALMCECCCGRVKTYKILYKTVVKRPFSVSLRSAISRRYFLDFLFSGFYFSKFEGFPSVQSTNLSFVFDSFFSSFSSFDNDVTSSISGFCIGKNSLVGIKFNEVWFYSNFHYYLSDDVFYNRVFDYCKTFFDSLRPHYASYASFLQGLPDYPSLPRYDIQQFYKQIYAYLASEPEILFEFVVSFDVRVSLDKNDIIENVEILSFDEISSQIN